VITRGRRAWLVTLAVVLLAKLVRRRRMICLNFVMTDEDLTLEQQDIFSANQVIHLRPISDDGAYREFLSANPFVTDLYPNFQPDECQPFAVPLGEAASRLKTAAEVVLAVPSLLIDAASRKVYGWHLRRRASSCPTPDQVQLQPGRLKLHTRSHRASLLEQFDDSCREALETSSSWEARSPHTAA
jgi:hypothetical protein